ncbi:MAG: hypothetical protein R3C10_11870 [Pirellulales bacterium]
MTQTNVSQTTTPPGQVHPQPPPKLNASIPPEAGDGNNGSPKQGWIWINQTNANGGRGRPSQQFSAGRTDKGGSTLFLNRSACEQLQIRQGTTLAIGYEATSDQLGIRIDQTDEVGAESLRSFHLSFGWFLRALGFRLLGHELYHIEANEPGADPPYIIPISGRKTQY